ncbi:MAG TPA: M48 family metallopeptidase [Candidatus Eisenbacteria bacterium]|jgi:Zn-dependent protease with chaperone function|nr:M48 family metallopeptidase [Candidatus Eisenbacteria bacterium]
MRIRHKFRVIAALSIVAALCSGTTLAQTAVKSGFNVFSAQQDVDLGRQSAAQIERQLPMVNRSNVNRYVSRIGARLAAAAPGERYAYQFKVPNLSDINAFALPGGFVYVHRGLIQRVRSEGELAGVMAHEIAHVALRHQTNQASKAYLARAGLGVLGGLLGGKSGNRVIEAVGGVGLNALFLKYSRSAEEQADIVGAQIMARAGYDPNDMARFFDLLRQEAGRDPSKVERFFSDHPAPADRATRVRREAASLRVRVTSPEGGLANVQADLRRLPPAPTLAQALKGQTTASSSGGGSAIEPPTLYRTYRQPRGTFQVDIPQNWQTASSSYGVTIAPQEGIVQTRDGGQELRAGVIIGHYVPFDGLVGTDYRDYQGSMFGRSTLAQATSDLVRQIMGTRPHLRVVDGSARTATVSGQRSLSVLLAGTNPSTGSGERMKVTTRELADGHVIYMLTFADESDYPDLEPAFDHVVRTLRVNEGATHD